MKTKEEVIKEAYGEYWSKFHIDVQKHALSNNGWIRIEKVEDLPMGVGECFVVDSVGRIEIMHYRYLRDCIVEGWAYTHYQPIVKPLKPLY